MNDGKQQDGWENEAMDEWMNGRMTAWADD